MKEYSTSDRIDEIYAQITAQESALKEKYILTIAGGVLVLFFILISSFILKQPSEPLDIRMEQSGLDEISANEEGASQASTFIFIEDEVIDEEAADDKVNLLQVEETQIPVLEAESASISLEVTGEQVTVSQLEFRILNFDPEYIYRVDFGNGEGKRIQETFSYSYMEPGLFDLKIMAYGKDKSKKKLVKQLEIKPWQNS